MAKKVALDTSDIEDTNVSLPDKPVEVETASDKPLAKGFPTWWFLLSIVMVVITIIVVGLTYWRGVTKKTAVNRVAPIVNKAESVTAPSKINLMAVNDFVMTINDDKGNKRLMLCDVTFELRDNESDGFSKNISEIRNIIYSAFMKRNTTTLMKPEGKSQLRDEISAGLDKLLGKDSVKSIYFT
ncbi:MAG: flagellar basal body-associated FliL family protein, partial [Syntrophales bacterium LBB04]|nr:flagellar basal body-associated FliL family protein [Syntrophales bacterium LBB04]